MDICCVFGKDMGDRVETLVENGLNLSDLHQDAGITV